MAGICGRKYSKDEDFEEEEVWGVTEELENNSNPKLRKPFKNSSFFSHSSVSRHFSAAPRIIPRSSSSMEVAYGKQSSAPVDIPDWSKIYGKISTKKKSGISASSSSWVNHDDDDDDHDGYYANSHVKDDYDDDDDDDDEMCPPHEYLARKLARSQISSFSVFEGIGRTLKGRDLSKVRNTILTETGFLE